MSRELERLSAQTAGEVRAVIACAILQAHNQLGLLLAGHLPLAAANSTTL